MTDIAWNCAKWADCSCAESGSCGCGETCGCGTVSVADVQKAMETECPLSDCSCGIACKCGKGNCNMGGTTEKTPAEWVESVKIRTAESVSGGEE